MDDPSTTGQQSPQIKERARTGCIVVVLALVTAIVMNLLAEYALTDTHFFEGRLALEFMSLVIGFVGIVWGFVLFSRASGILSEKQHEGNKDGSRAKSRVQEQASTGCVISFLATLTGCVMAVFAFWIGRNDERSDVLLCVASIISGVGSVWAVRIVLRSKRREE
jgi:uncharacterized membrane protein YqjE